MSRTSYSVVQHPLPSISKPKACPFLDMRSSVLPAASGIFEAASLIKRADAVTSPNTESHFWTASVKWYLNVRARVKLNSTQVQLTVPGACLQENQCRIHWQSLSHGTILEIRWNSASERTLPVVKLCKYIYNYFWHFLGSFVKQI